MQPEIWLTDWATTPTLVIGSLMARNSQDVNIIFFPFKEKTPLLEQQRPSTTQKHCLKAASQGKDANYQLPTTVAGCRQEIAC